MTDLLYEREGAYEEGLEKGMEKGRAEGLREMAKALLADGDSIEKVMRISGLSKEEILAL